MEEGENQEEAAQAVSEMEESETEEVALVYQNLVPED